MAFGEVFSSAKPYVLMVLLQVGYAGMYIISVASLKQGMNHFVLVVYRNIVAAAVMAPFAYWFERRKKIKPKITVPIFLKIMALGLLEPVLDQNLYYMGAKATSAGFSSALYNILPAITFLLAFLLRMEKVNIRKPRSQAKVIGTLVTVAGALVMILYTGPMLKLPGSDRQSHSNANTTTSQEGGDWLKGTFLLIASCICWSSFFIVQASTLKSYPAELTLTTLICVAGAGQSGAIALVMARGAKPWTIGFDLRLLTAVYSGIVCSGIAYYVQGMVSRERGPVFVTAFNPLCMMITASLGCIILGEQITLGRVIGAVIIVFGLYSLLWGKGKEHSASTSESGDQKQAFELPKTATDVIKA